jgi:hypothetical protein
MFSDNPASKLATALRILAPFWSVSGCLSLKLLSSRLPAALVARGEPHGGGRFLLPSSPGQVWPLGRTRLTLSEFRSNTGAQDRECATCETCTPAKCDK